MVLKVGVIGLGHMGSAHARIYSRLTECELVCVCDANSDKKNLAKKLKCKFFDRIEHFLKEDLDAVSICTPTSSHMRVALDVLKERKHVLIEKPLAMNVNEAKEILNARKSGILAVGHIERFNPAVIKLKENVDFSNIYSTISLRFGPYPPRIKDVGVILDLASHEIDLLNYLTKTQPKVLYVYVSSHFNNGVEDYAYLSLKYGHLHSHIETSWIPAYKLRLINLYGNKNFYSLNYAQQKIRCFRAPPHAKIDSGSWQDILWLSRNVSEDISVIQIEPLELELNCFLESIRNGEIINPLCSGREGLDFLQVVDNAANLRALSEDKPVAKVKSQVPNRIDLHMEWDFKRPLPTCARQK